MPPPLNLLLFMVDQLAAKWLSQVENTVGLPNVARLRANVFHSTTHLPTIKNMEIDLADQRFLDEFDQALAWLVSNCE